MDEDGRADFENKSADPRGLRERNLHAAYPPVGSVPEKSFLSNAIPYLKSTRLPSSVGIDPPYPALPAQSLVVSFVSFPATV